MNGQVLVFNTNLTLYNVINILTEHNILCAVLWDETTRKFVDLFTIRDVMELVVYITEQLEARYPHKAHTLPDNDPNLVREFLSALPEEVKARKKKGDMGYEYKFLLTVLKSVKLRDWAHFTSKIIGYRPEILLTKSLKDSLLDACREMSSRKIHRLAVIETGSKGTNLCGIITHDMIMGYIISNMQGDPSIFDVPIKELHLDTKKLIGISSKANLFQVLQRMRDSKVSFLPITAEPLPGSTVFPTIGFFTLKDFIKLIQDKKYHMVR
eukprot:TRINITY_DN5317_c0_g3_i2.p1 TRINITY_DN5317_c0_g3~~TRINITY_DN5317_c0_g3_i2.p1  ORF type:complete len:268 (-),score=69.34 TRINITY_DN5317_c0_g3_i2:445-1248(-)